MPSLSIESPVGPLAVHEDSGCITRLSWSEVGTDATPLLLEAQSQIQAYFAGRLQRFDLPLRLEVSPFVQQVCTVMQAIGFGKTRTYGDIAKELGAAAQPVGQACGANPIPVIIPCHRVLSATGLGGFSGEGGSETKVALLVHEGAGGYLL
ncbi:methylated-DNA--[protein]-cysteine S-methyltransferase [Thalassobius sp. MITS945101]|uniref:methylated-DNA--[protein]-cysteine S-methyltransferase n=1 Tax=Thalassobius sp. MITS945101 TaxID=3096994 RepID=UPI00399A669E